MVDDMTVAAKLKAFAALLQDALIAGFADFKARPAEMPYAFALIMGQGNYLGFTARSQTMRLPNLKPKGMVLS